MASGGQQDFLKRLQQFYGDVVMNVVHVYFEREVLDKTTLFLFLDKHKHELFHELIPKISCCECFKSNSIASVSKTGCLDEFQFDLLYDRSACSETNHEIKRGQKFQQHCVCNINPKIVEVADLDIILIRAVIKTCCKRTLPGNPSWLKEIKDVRNYIDHIGNSYRISKSDFEEKWSRLETNTLNIALMTGKSFQFMTQKDIHKLKAEHDTIDRIQAVAENANDSLKEEILNALKNQPGVKQDEIGQISYQLDQILFKITDLEVQISTKQKADVIESERKEDPTKCYVRWTLSTPSSWRVEDIKRKLRSVAELTNFTIEFVYAGSLIIDTSVSLDMITDPERFCIASLEFLRSFVKSCEIDTTVAISVDIKVLASFLPYRETERAEELTFGSCRTCSNRNLTTEAEKWCKDCQELYCHTCSMYHTATTHLAYHTILSLSDSMEHFPPNIPQNITCNEHDRDFNFFCKTHQQIICVECVRVDHTNCADIVSLSFAALNTKSSSIFENLVSHVQELIADTEQVLSDFANLSSAIELQNTNIKSAIADKFKGISFGNEIMNTTFNELKSKHEVCKAEIEKTVRKVMTIKQKISKIDVQLYQMKEYCSERQAFFFIHNIVKSITRADKTFRTSLSDTKTLSLYYKSGETFNIEGYEVEKLEIVLNYEPYIIHSAKKDAKNKQAQVPISISSIDKIKLSNKITFHLRYKVMKYLKVVCLNDKVIIFNNTATGLLVYNIMGSFEKEIEFPHGDKHRLKELQNRNSWLTIKDITVINKDCIAVMRKNDVLSVNVEKGYVNCIINNRNLHSYHILCYCEDFLYLFDRNNITVIDLAGNFVKTINCEIVFHGITSYVVRNNKIFFLSKVLSCFDLNGQLLWQSKILEREFQSDIQISVDNWGNCYIPSDVSKNIKVISNCGHQSKLLLSVTDSIRYPRAVYFDKTSNRLIVMNLYGICTMFDVSLKE